MGIFISYSNCNHVIIPAQSTLLYLESTTVYSPENNITDNKPNALNPIVIEQLIHEERYNNIKNNNNNNT